MDEVWFQRRRVETKSRDGDIAVYRGGTVMVHFVEDNIHFIRKSVPNFIYE
ncbi:unnamed protein product [Sphenostylis stenocarpa]|uniref:Uncharacterized protein n=1 Tax=Sphenostylis stenocarpa TaxID=92480 RepID=A0AA86VN06_9FABA|nr:unnamed protein product [Sphenostylis stenocarpa]